MNQDSITYIFQEKELLPQNGEVSTNSSPMFIPFENNDLYLSFDSTQTVRNETYISSILDGHVGIKRIFSLEQADGVFGLLLLCFICFTQIYKGGFSFFRENSRLVFTSRKNLNFFSETTITEFWYNFILIFQTVLTASIVFFAFFLESETSTLVQQNSFFTITLFLLAIYLFLGAKYVLYRFIGYIFNENETVNIWIRSYVIIIEMGGIIGFIPLLLLVYSTNYHTILLTLFLFLFIVSRLIIFYRLIAFFLRENVNFLYWIAYLCSVEILPYVLLYNSLSYLYKIDVINLIWP